MPEKYLTTKQIATSLQMTELQVRSIIINASKNGVIEPSFVISDIIKGGIIVRLNRESKIPSIRRITASCIIIFSR